MADFTNTFVGNGTTLNRTVVSQFVSNNGAAIDRDPKVGNSGAAAGSTISLSIVGTMQPYAGGGGTANPRPTVGQISPR